MAQRTEANFTFRVRKPHATEDLSADVLVEFLLNLVEADGNATDQANHCYHDLSLSVAGGPGSATINLNTALDIDGNALGLDSGEVAWLIIKAESSNPDYINVEPAASNGWDQLVTGTSPELNIAPGGTLIWHNPSSSHGAVTSSTNVLQIENPHASTAATCRVIIIGRK